MATVRTCDSCYRYHPISFGLIFSREGRKDTANSLDCLSHNAIEERSTYVGTFAPINRACSHVGHRYCFVLLAYANGLRVVGAP